MHARMVDAPDGHPGPAYDAEALRAAVASGGFRSFAATAFRDLEEDGWQALVTQAVDAHNRGELDLLAAAARATDPPGPYYHDPFYKEALGRLDADPATMIAACVDLAKDHPDGPPYHQIEAIASWCAGRTDRVDWLVDAIRAGRAPAAFLIAALNAGVALDRTRFVTLALDLLSADSLVHAPQTAFALGLIECGEDEATQSAIVEALRAGSADPDMRKASACFDACLSIAARTAERHATALLDAIAIAAARDAPQLRAKAAAALWLKGKTFAPVLVTPLAALLRSTRPDEDETINSIDQLIAAWLRDDRADQGLALLEALIRSGTRIDLFDSVAHHLLTDMRSRLDRLVITWLRDGDLSLCHALHKLLSQRLSEPMRFAIDVTPYGLSNAERVYMVRKAIAHFFILPVTAASIAMSLLRGAGDTAARTIVDLLFDPLLLNYPGEARTYVEACRDTEDGPITARLSDALTRLDVYLADLARCPPLSEYRPSERHRFIEAMRRQEEAATIQKGSRGGVLSSLMTTSVLLYGDSAITDVHVAPGETRRQEFPLGTVEISHEIARHSVLDPFGLQYRLTTLKLGRARS